MQFLHCFTIIAFLLSTPFIQRRAGESAEAFVLRQFTKEEERDILDIHPVIEYAWGDTRKGKKLINFLPPASSKDGMMEAAIWLPQGENQYKCIRIRRILFTGGGEAEKVLSVFFQDIDGDGDKELLFIKEGIVKAYKDLHAADDTSWQNAPYRRKTYSTFIYQQTKVSGQYLDEFEPITWPYLLTRLDGLKTAAEVHQVIRDLQR